MGFFKPALIAHAHCHVPCGIYDPAFAQNAAETVVKMVEQLIALEPPGSNAQAADHVKFHHDVARRAATKEEYAKQCKSELLEVLWSQYFKPAHVERWPDLHDKFFRAGHLCTQNMQEIDMARAQELLALVNEIADIFHKSKQG